MGWLELKQMEAGNPEVFPTGATMARFLVGRVWGRTLNFESTQAISLELKQAWARVPGDAPHPMALMRW